MRMLRPFSHKPAPAFRYAASFGAALVGCFGFLLVAMPQPAAAKGETYTWASHTTITGSGGHFAKPVTFSTISGDQSLLGTVQYTQPCATDSGTKANAFFDMFISLAADSKTGSLNTQGSQSQPSCNFTPGSPSPGDEYDNTTITIQGTRPGGGGGPTETFQWVSANSIEGSGGDFATPVVFNYVPGTSDNVSKEYYALRVDYTQICTPTENGAGGGKKYNGHVALYITVNNPAAFGGTAPSPTINIDAKDTTDDIPPGPQYPYSYACDVRDGSPISNKYNGSDITIQCDPAKPCQGPAETHDQKAVLVILHSAQSAANSPKQVTMEIQTPDGKPVAGQTATSGQNPETTPPGTTLVYYNDTFYLEAGNYQVCFTPAIAPCQKFTKVKYNPLRVDVGINPFDQIDVILRAHFLVTGCWGGTYKVGPGLVALENQQGVQLDVARTNFTLVTVDEGNCNVQVVANLSTQFLDVAPGSYQVCANSDTGEQVCQNVVKIAGQTPSVTIDVTLGFLMPADQPSCSTGTGWASGIAWSACTILPVLINTLLFFQNNLIEPLFQTQPLGL